MRHAVIAIIIGSAMFVIGFNVGHSRGRAERWQKWECGRNYIYSETEPKRLLRIVPMECWKMEGE